MADAMMEFLGEANGVKWYWAEPGRFERPGVYYWDGTSNVLCVPYPAKPEAPAQAAQSAGEVERMKAPEEIVRYAKAMQKDGYRGPLTWASAIIDWVAALSHKEQR